MVTAKELYFHIKKTLEQNKIDSFQFESMCIVEEIFNMKLEKILLSSIIVSEEQLLKADNIAYRRIKGEPLQYLLGKWEFYGLEFFVGEGVLIPRQDTETLVETALNLNLPSNPKILDLCSGSGCIGITLDKNIKNAKITAVEISEKAARYIDKNIKLNNSDMKLTIGDVRAEETAKQFSEVDLIVCNPPYLTSDDMEKLQREVSFEPEIALFGGKNGLDFYNIITKIWKKTLKPDGIIAYEIGMGQEKDVINILKNNNFTDIQTANDLCNITRVVYGKNCMEENYGKE